VGEDAEVNALVAEIIDMLNRGERIYLHCRYTGSLPFSGSCPVVPHLDRVRARSQWRTWAHRHHRLHSSGYALSSLLHEASVSVAPDQLIDPVIAQRPAVRAHGVRGTRAVQALPRLSGRRQGQARYAVLPTHPLTTASDVKNEHHAQESTAVLRHTTSDRKCTVSCPRPRHEAGWVGLQKKNNNR
jgi:hypothetical protein